MGVVSKEFVEGVNAAQGCTAEVYAVVVSEAALQTVRSQKGYSKEAEEKFPPYPFRRYKIV